MQKYSFGLYILALILLLVAMPILIQGAAGSTAASCLGMMLIGIAVAISLLLRDKK